MAVLVLVAGALVVEVLTEVGEVGLFKVSVENPLAGDSLVRDSGISGSA